MLKEAAKEEGLIVRPRSLGSRQRRGFGEELVMASSYRIWNGGYSSRRGVMSTPIEKIWMSSSLQLLLEAQMWTRQGWKLIGLARTSVGPATMTVSEYTAH